VPDLKKVNKVFFLYPVLLLALLGLLIVSNKSDKESATLASGETTKTSTGVYLEHSLTEPSSPWVVVNKHSPLPIEYSPKLIVPNVPLTMDSATENMKLSSEIKTSIERLFEQAGKQGIKLRLGSGYRSADTQETLYESYVSEQGQPQADKYSARPGYSEHQTGLAADIVSNDNYCYLQECWANTPEGKWLASNAHKFGYIVRYLKGKQSITGYNYEPWHIRFVGVDTATKIYNSGKTMEEYFGLQPAPDYLPS
jgi:D-alanyl-D-alanine carboxypeptidase